MYNYKEGPQWRGLVGLVSDIIQNWTMGWTGPGGGVTGTRTLARGQMGAWVKGWWWPRLGLGTLASLDTLFRASRSAPYN